MAAAMVIIGLWPFAFRPTNQAHWLADGSGLQFRPDGIVYDPEPLPASARPATPDTPASVTMELWVEPDLEPQDDVHHLLTIHDERLPSNLVLCQWKTELLLRIPGETKRGFRETGVHGALEERRTKVITMTCGPEGTSWYFDGVPVMKSPGFTLPSDALNGRLILGDAAGGKHAWSGRIYGLAVFNRTLNDEEVLKHSQAWTNDQALQLAGEPDLMTLLPFHEGQGQRAQDQSPHRHRVFIPQPYRTLHKSVLAWPSKAEKWVSRDVWVNLLGFVPFGFLLYWHQQSTPAARRLRSAGYALLLGGALSLVIEVTQIWLPNRDSSSLDLLCNALGTLLGVCAAMLAQSRTTGVSSTC